MSNNLSVSDITPLGERPADVWRGRTGVLGAGVFTMGGSPFSGLPALSGDFYVYDAATDTWVLVNTASLGVGIDIATYGAVDDATGVNDAAVSGGALSTVTSATAAFTSADTGKRYTLSTTTGTITRGTLTYVNATTATMSAAAGGAITGGRLIWFTDNTAAVVAAFAAAVPGDRVVVGPGRWGFYGPNLTIPVGVHFGPIEQGPYFPDTAVYANTWGATLVFDHSATDPFLLLEQGSGVGDFLMFDAGQVPPTATTPVARGAFIQVDVDSLPWSSRETRVAGWRIGSPYLTNPYVGLYLRGGSGLVDAPQIGGLYRSVIIDHNYDFISIRRIKADRLACISEAPSLGETGLNSWYKENAWGVGIYRSDGFKIHELSTYAMYGGIFLKDSPDGPQDPGAIENGYGLIGLADIDSCVIGIYADSTNTPGLLVGEFICGPNVLGGTAGAYGVWTNTGGSVAPLVVIGTWAVRGSWSVAVSQRDAGTLIVPSTNPGSGAGDAEGAVAIRYIFDSTTTNSDPGAGKVRLSSGSPQSSSVTVRADLADVAGADVTQELAAIGDQTGTTKGYLRLQHTTDPTKWLLFDATAFASPSGYRNITVSVRSGSATSPFANGDPLTLVFVPSTVGLTAGTIPSFATPSIALGTAAAAGAASTVIRSDATIVAFDATVPAAVGTAAAGVATVTARRDHVHPTGAGTPSTQALGDAAATGSGPAAAMTDHKHAMPAAAITSSGLTIATARLAGRTTGATGAIEEISVGTGLSLSGGSLTATGAVTQTFHGARAYHGSTQTVAAGSNIPMLLNTENYDTDAYHFTSAANLTGTVQKTGTSAAIVGTGTSFTTELAVNQVISIPGTATEIGVVKTITDNTHLTLWQTMANSASGQTATRQSCFMAIPSGMGGYYHLSGGLNWTTITTAKNSLAEITVNGNLTGGGTTYAISSQVSTTSLIQYLTVASDVSLVAGDYFAIYFNNSESGTVTIATNNAWSPHLSCALIGV